MVRLFGRSESTRKWEQLIEEELKNRPQSCPRSEGRGGVGLMSAGEEFRHTQTRLQRMLVIVVLKIDGAEIPDLAPEHFTNEIVGLIEETQITVGIDTQKMLTNPGRHRGGVSGIDIGKSSHKE